MAFTFGLKKTLSLLLERLPDTTSMSSTVARFPLQRVKRWTHPALADPIDPLPAPGYMKAFAQKADLAVDGLIEAVRGGDETAIETAKEVLAARIIELLRGSLLEARENWKRAHRP